MSVLHRMRIADEAGVTVIPRPAADSGEATGCAVCPHPWDFHDRIAARFCVATIAGKFSRGCVCTAYPNKEKAHDK